MMEDLHSEKTIETVNKKRKYRRIAGILLIVISLVIVGLVVYFTLKDDMPASWGDFFNALPTFFTNYYLLAALGCMIVVILFSALNFYLLIRSQNGRRYPKDSIRLHVVGRYYDHISPYSAAGEPYQVYHLRKLHLSTGQATSITFTHFTTSRLAFLTLSVVFFIAVRDLKIETWVRVIAYIGAFTSTVLPVLIMTLLLSKKITKRLLKWAYAIINKFPFKNKEYKKISLTRNVRQFHYSMKDVGQNLSLLFVLYINALIVHFATAAVPYFVIKAVPAQFLQPVMAQELNLSNMIALSLYTTCFTNLWPTPGGIGGAELSFGRIFNTYITGSHLTWAMFIWRFLTFYMYIIVGFILVVISAARVKNQKKRPKATTPKLNTFQFADNFYPTVDGVVKVVDNYARYLNKDGYNTKIVVPDYRDANDENFTYEVIRLPSFKPSFTQYAVAKRRTSRQLMKRFNEQHPVVLHAHSPFLVGHKALRIAHKYDLPIIGTFHTQYHQDFYQMSKSKLVTRLALRYVLNFYRACDEVWAVSPLAARVLKSYGYKGPIKVMENGLELHIDENLANMVEEVYQEYCIKKEEKNLLFVGQLIWQKNIKMVLDTYARLLKSDASYRLIMVGGAGNEKEVKAYAKEIAIYDKIIWTGEIKERAKMQAMYSVADLFFFPSLYETFSIVLRESALMGIPALVAEGGVCAEAVEDGVTGFVAVNEAEAMANKIEEIFSNDILRKEVGLNAQKDLPVAWESIVNDVAIQYERVVKNFYAELETKVE